MKLSNFAASLGLFSASVLAATEVTPDMADRDPNDVLIDLQAMAIQALNATSATEKRAAAKGCSLANAQVRQDW
jgi:hypothetical protein